MQKLIAALLIASECAAVLAQPQISGPTLLHGSVAGQWGGHTYSYMVVGDRAVFWGAREWASTNAPDTILIGQYPTPGSRTPPSVTRIKLDGPLNNCNPPQIVRSPDGYIHVFVGWAPATSNPNMTPGSIRYFRSEKPEDITNLIDRTELIPKQPFSQFHLRMNAGISRDGRRLALVILAISEDGSVPFNTPVIFQAEKRGADYVFDEPARYAEPMGLFYPLIAVVDSGVVVVGEVWDNQNRAISRLIHLDRNGAILHREDLPAEVDGRYLVHDMRPSDGSWEKFLLYYNKTPASMRGCRHEFLEYDTVTTKLRVVRSVPTDYSSSNPGKWLVIPGGGAVFVNNPSSGQLSVWVDDSAGRVAGKRLDLAPTAPSLFGLPGSYYISAPNPLVGSRTPGKDLFLMLDCPNWGKAEDQAGPCSLLLWRLETKSL